MSSTKILPVALFTALMASAGSSTASTLLECQDARLATISAQQLLESVQTAGGLDCRLQSQPWGDSVSCERVSDVSAYGLAVREISGEVHQNGLRTLSIVTPSTEARTREAMRTLNPAAGLRAEVQSRDDGVTTVRCIAEPTDASDSATTGAINGRTPPLPPGATTWEVCAQPATGTPVCAMADRQTGDYQINGLNPGDYGLLATPHDATDPLLRALLIRGGSLGENRQGGPKVLAGQISVRSGALTHADELALLRLPPGH